MSQTDRQTDRQTDMSIHRNSNGNYIHDANKAPRESHSTPVPSRNGTWARLSDHGVFFTVDFTVVLRQIADLSSAVPCVCMGRSVRTL